MKLFLKNLLFTVLVPGTVAGYVPLTIVDGLPVGTWGWIGLGSLFFGVGLGIYGWCLWNFAVTGRGTPAPIDEPKQLVVQGLYRYTRNPMYVGVLSVILGWAFTFASVPVVYYGGGVGLFFHSLIVLYEEPHLKKKFGAEYERYCARVGRWLPKLRRVGDNQA